MDEYIKRKDAEEALYEYRMSLTMSQFVDVETCIESRGIVEGAMNVIAGLPTADVVPKSEVKDLIYKLECLLCHSTGGMLSKYSYDFQTMESAVTDYINKVYYEGYDEAKAEVAREVIEKIESVMFNRFSNIMLGEDIRLCLAELKKKYQEGATE